MVDAPIAGWRAWYTEGRVFDSRETAWRDLPLEGVLVVAVYYDAFAADAVRYRTLYDGDEYYWYADGGVHSSMSHPDVPDVPAERIKRGTEVADEEFAAVKDRAVASTWL